METWDDIIKKLPSDETLERLEKNGELEKFDQQLQILEERIKKLREKLQSEESEMGKMLVESKKEDDTKEEKRLLS